jgi:hypothetical protein
VSARADAALCRIYQGMKESRKVEGVDERKVTVSAATKLVANSRQLGMVLCSLPDAND